MSLLLALKSFFKALREPQEAQKFLIGSDESPKPVATDASHLRLLQMLQNSGRFIDFIKEDISAYNDAQVGSVVRKLHEDCAKQLEEVVTVRGILDDEEGSEVQLPEGYDATEVKVVGNVRGNPPYKGKLVHKGWKAHKRSLPKQVGESAEMVICQAEVEVI